MKSTLIRVGMVCSMCLPLLGCGGGEPVTEVRGAGASFPAPIYQRWFKEYSDAHPDAKIEYASVGSGAGVNQFTQDLVDFGASDAAMSDEEIASVEKGVQLLPMTAGAIVICYNLSDASGKPIEDLKLSRDAYTGIYLGKITSWDDSAIADANPDVKLPSKPISVVYRSDSSGTTYVFSQHLAEVSEEWKAGPGVSKTMDWPIGSGAPKNDGVAGAVKSAEGSIGYVEYGFAEKTGIPMASLENQAGKFIKPSSESAQAALGSIEEMPSDMRIWLPDPSGSEAYPIVTYTWIMCYKSYDDAQKWKVLKDALTYCLTDGQKVSEELGYIPLPESVVQKVIAALDTIESSAPATDAT